MTEPQQVSLQRFDDASQDLRDVLHDARAERKAPTVAEIVVAIEEVRSTLQVIVDSLVLKGVVNVDEFMQARADAIEDRRDIYREHLKP